MGASLKACGGGDEAEEVMGALTEASQWKDWKGNVKILMLIGDAPGHGMSNDASRDNYPKGYAGIPPANIVMQKLADQSIDLFFCRINRNKTEKMEHIMRQHYDDREQCREIVSIDIFDDALLQASRFHVIFVLDESLSMKGSRWTALKQALHAFIARRQQDQAEDEIVSIITFDDTARVKLQYSNYTEALNWDDPPNKGSTNFEIALHTVENLLRTHTQSAGTPVVLFMSDGEDQSNNAISCVENIMRLHGNKGVTINTVGVAGGATGTAAALLRNMASLGKGK